MIVLGFLIFLLNPSFADDHSRFAKQRQSEGLGHFKKGKKEEVTGYKGDHPQETNFYNHGALATATGKEFQQNEHAQHYLKVAEERPFFQMDAENDPLVQNTTEALSDPEKYIQKSSYKNRKTGKFKTKVCTESKPNTKLTCVKTLIEPSIHIEPAKYSHYWCSQGNHAPDDPRCRAKTYYNPARKYKDEVVTITHEEWASTCGTLESHAQKGVCRLVSKSCPRGAETRDIVASVAGNGKPTIRSVTRPCWQYKMTYHCSYPTKDTCSSLRKSGCEQVKSQCLKKIGDMCVQWRQEFRCYQEPQKEEVLKVSQKEMKLEGAKSHAQATPNNEMNDAISKLQVFQEMQKELKTAGEGMPQVFKGCSLACTKAFAGFNNCCKDRGWGQSISGCNADEKKLAQEREKKRCVGIGEYCSKKVAGVCVQKKHRYCCFPSKLSRVFHEQGRRQLGIGWGSPKNPQCRGFETDELSRLDFSKLDLQEVYDEIAARMKNKTTSIVKRNLSTNIKSMMDDLGNDKHKGDF